MSQRLPSINHWLANWKIVRNKKDRQNDSNIECIKISLKKPWNDFFKTMIYQVINPYHWWSGLFNWDDIYSISDDKSADDSEDDESFGNSVESSSEFKSSDVKSVL